MAALERLTGINFPQLHEAIHAQQNEVGRYIAARQELVAPNFSAWLEEIDGASTAEAGGKAAALAEVKNQIGLPVPDGYVIMRKPTAGSVASALGEDPGCHP